MFEAYVVDAVPKPVGHRKGGFAGIHPVDLVSPSLKASGERAGIDGGGQANVSRIERQG